MTISHHSHSGEFCLHAKGTLLQVVEEAVRQGFTTFGLSEHIPRYKVEHLYPEEVRTVIVHLSRFLNAVLTHASSTRALVKTRLTSLRKISRIRFLDT